MVVGLGFGDEGKGTMVDYLTAKKNVPLVVRFNGGGQAAHNVVLPDGRHHTFSQFGSGSLQGAATFLSKHVLFDPFAAIVERKHLLELGGNTEINIHRDCPVVTPYHRVANRIHERVRAVDGNRHGSCGLGIGETEKDRIAGVILPFATTKHFSDTLKILKIIQDKKLSELPRGWESCVTKEEIELMKSSPDQWAAQYSDAYFTFSTPKDYAFLKVRLQGADAIFEGAQGVLLDENYGFAPYNTWSTTTFKNAEEILKETQFSGLVARCGVIRSYMTRHGAGPFPSEGMLSVPDKPNEKTKVEHNDLGPWQGAFRTGHLDIIALRYALEVCGGVDHVAVTHMDCDPRTYCESYVSPVEIKSPSVFGGFDKTIMHIYKDRAVENMNELTKVLMGCKPVVKKTPNTLDPEDGTIEIIERLLHVDVKYVSNGPTCRDKEKLR